MFRRVTEGSRRATGVTLLNTPQSTFAHRYSFLTYSHKKLHNEPHTVFYIPVLDDTSDCYKMKNTPPTPHEHPCKPDSLLCKLPHTSRSSKAVPYTYYPTLA